MRKWFERTSQQNTTKQLLYQNWSAQWNYLKDQWALFIHHYEKEFESLDRRVINWKQRHNLQTFHLPNLKQYFLSQNIHFNFESTPDTSGLFQKGESVCIFPFERRQVQAKYTVGERHIYKIYDQYYPEDYLRDMREKDAVYQFLNEMIHVDKVVFLKNRKHLKTLSVERIWWDSEPKCQIDSKTYTLAQARKLSNDSFIVYKEKFYEDLQESMKYFEDRRNSAWKKRQRNSSDWNDSDLQYWKNTIKVEIEYMQLTLETLKQSVEKIFSDSIPRDGFYQSKFNDMLQRIRYLRKFRDWLAGLDKSKQTMDHIKQEVMQRVKKAQKEWEEAKQKWKGSPNLEGEAKRQSDFDLNEAYLWYVFHLKEAQKDWPEERVPWTVEGKPTQRTTRCRPNPTSSRSDFKTLWVSQTRPEEFYEKASEMLNLLKSPPFRINKLTEEDKEFIYKELGSERKGPPKQNLYVFLLRKLKAPNDITKIDSEAVRNAKLLKRERVSHLQELLSILGIPEDAHAGRSWGKNRLRLRF